MAADLCSGLATKHREQCRLVSRAAGSTPTRRFDAARARWTQVAALIALR
jgi:hypothetical protein